MAGVYPSVFGLIFGSDLFAVSRLRPPRPTHKSETIIRHMKKEKIFSGNVQPSSEEIIKRNVPNKY
jgi:hypothetical protein